MILTPKPPPAAKPGDRPHCRASRAIIDRHLIDAGWRIFRCCRCRDFRLPHSWPCLGRPPPTPFFIAYAARRSLLGEKEVPPLYIITALAPLDVSSFTARVKASISSFLVSSSTYAASRLLGATLPSPCSFSTSPQLHHTHIITTTRHFDAGCQPPCVRERRWATARFLWALLPASKAMITSRKAQMLGERAKMRCLYEDAGARLNFTRD